MTKVSFYIIEEDSAKAANSFYCRLTEKVLSHDNTVYIHTRDHLHAGDVDDQLWSFQEEKFIPHQLFSVLPHTAKVLIGHEDSPHLPDTYHDVLINLHDETPAFFSQFERVAEIVQPDEQSKKKGRERFQFYRDRGYSLETHKLKL